MNIVRSNKSFRRLFLGGIVTNAGDSLYFIAAMWLVHDITGSTFYTGLAGFLVQGPTVLGFLAGPYVDRWPLRRILTSSQVLQGLSVLLVPLAAYFDALSVWVVLLIMPVLSFVNQFVYSAQSAVLPRLVSDDQLVRANSMLSMSTQGLDMFFNAASGILIAAIGAVSLYIVDSVTFFLATLLFLGISVTADAGSADDEDAPEGDASRPTDDEDAADEVAMANGDDEDAADEVAMANGEGAGVEADDGPEADESDGDEETYFEKLWDGIDYMRGSALVPMLLGLLVVNFVFGTGLAVFPAFAAGRGGPQAYGFYMAAVAAGNLVGALGANFVEDVPFGPFNGVSKVAIGGLVAGAVLTTSLLASLVLLFFGFVLLGMGVVMSSSIRQSAVDQDLLGRVSSVSQSVSSAMLPVGSLIGGVLATVLGVDGVLLMIAGSISLYGVYFIVHPQLRALPSVAAADEDALGL